MSFEINLLTKKPGFSPELLQASKIVRKIAYFTVGIFILLVITVLSLDIFFKQQTNDMDKKILLAKQNIELAKKTESLYLAYYQKLASVDDLIKNRFYPEKIILSIKTALPAEAVLSGIIISPENITLSVEMTSLETLDAVINGLQGKLNFSVKEINVFGIEKVKGKYQAKFMLPMVTNKTVTKNVKK